MHRRTDGVTTPKHGAFNPFPDGFAGSSIRCENRSTDRMNSITQAVRQTADGDMRPVSVTEPAGLLVVDDHVAVRRGLYQLLSEQPDFHVLGAASCAEEAMLIAELERPAVAVIDFQLPRRNGLWLTRKLKHLPTAPRVLIYSAYGDGLLTASSVMSGADGLVSKARLGAELCHAIRRVARGQSEFPAIPPAVSELLRQRLDDEEQAVFGMALAGIPRPEIAQILQISRARLESRISQMLGKFEARGGVEST